MIVCFVSYRQKRGTRASIREKDAQRLLLSVLLSAVGYIAGLQAHLQRPSSGRELTSGDKSEKGANANEDNRGESARPYGRGEDAVCHSRVPASLLVECKRVRGALG